MKKWIFTSESVTEGHPDKVCDQISDEIVDEILKDDKDARVACETMATTGLILITGEITTKTYVDFTKIAREVLEGIGYNRAKFGFDATTCAVLSAIKDQSADIAMGVDRFKDKNFDEDEFDAIGAGDQGMMFGYACKETDEYMPLPISLAHKLSRKLSEIRKNNTLEYLRPDGKSQVSVEYENGIPKRIENVVISAQHSPDVSIKDLRNDIKKEVIDTILPKNLVDENTSFYINPTGRFVVGGPMGDAGLTGRKIIVDTYGGYARHGGGAFSGKDPTKVDRSAAYYARYIAKNLVASGVCDKVEIGLAYAIGLARPTSIYVETFGTGKIPDNEIEKLVNRHFDPRPAAIIKNLNLLRPIYRKVASYGHFGRNDLDLSWEKLDKVDEIKKDLNL